MRRTSTGEVKLDAIKCDYDNYKGHQQHIKTAQT